MKDIFREILEREREEQEKQVIVMD